MQARLTMALLLTLAGCGGGAGNDDDATEPRADAGPTADAAPEAEKYAHVMVLEGTGHWIDGQGHAVPSPFGWITARFLGSAEPQWQEEKMAIGACRMLVYKLAFCADPCNGVCYANNVCRPWPEYQSAGTLTFSGLRMPVTVAPDGNNTYYQPTAPVTEIFADDATIRVSASGATTPAFSVTVRGVPELVPDIENGAITLENHQDHRLRWTPAPGSDARVRLTLNSANGAHGAPWDAIIECDVPDSAGEVTIPAAMIDAFPETQVWAGCVGGECPPSWIRRYHESVVPLPGRGLVSFIAGSELEFGVEHHPQP